jgi:hypothetical protein
MCRDAGDVGLPASNRRMQHCRQSYWHIVESTFLRFCRLPKACVLLTQDSSSLALCLAVSSSGRSKRQGRFTQRHSVTAQYAVAHFCVCSEKKYILGLFTGVIYEVKMIA